MSAAVTANLVLAYSVYAIGVASPGPSNLAIMGAAMSAGRRAAMLMALGVVSGSVFWGFLAAFGLSAVLVTYAGTLILMKLLGGLYLSWLAFNSARAASQPHTQPAARGMLQQSGFGIYTRGALMHITNPKAIFVWLSIVSLAVPVGAHARDALLVVCGCLPLGLAIFCGYALAFSTSAVRCGYLAVRRGFEAGLALVFGYAGIRLLVPVAIHVRQGMR